MVCDFSLQQLFNALLCLLRNQYYIIFIEKLTVTFLFIEDKTFFTIFKIQLKFQKFCAKKRKILSYYKNLKKVISNKIL